MVSASLINLSSPVARSCLMALGITLLIDAIITIYSAIQYPCLLPYCDDDLYISHSRTITLFYLSISLVAILVSISTAVATYKSSTNYVLIHGGLTGVFLPITILVYFSTISGRYNPSDYFDHQFISDYRISNSQQQQLKPIRESNNDDSEHIVKSLASVELLTAPTGHRLKLNSFTNHIDSIQKKFSCCGVDSVHDWIKQWQHFIPPTCCEERSSSSNQTWSTIFHLNPDHIFQYCEEAKSFRLGCLAALKEDEHSKYNWLGDLIVFMIVITIANTIFSLLLFGLSKTDDNVLESDHELSIVGVSDKPRLSQPTITSMKHRPSVYNLGSSSENLATRAQAVRFNISSIPPSSTSGKSKFSAAARRGSSFI